MAFCSKCGNNVPDGVKFCPQCGAAMGVDVGSGIPMPNTPTNPNMPNVQVNPNMQGMPNIQNMPNASGKKANGTVIAVVGIVAATIIVVALIVVLFVYPGVLKDDGNEADTQTVVSSSSSEEKSDKKSEAKPEEKSEEKSEAESAEKPSSSTVEKAEESTVRKPADFEPKSPPASADFAWLNEYVNTDFEPTEFVQDTGELVGNWKGYIVGDVTTTTLYDGVERVMNVEMTDNNGDMTMTINWYQFIADGHVTDDSAAAQTYTAHVNDGDTGIQFNGTYESIYLGTFYYDGDNQRAVGVFTFSDGTKSYFALTRP